MSFLPRNAFFYGVPKNKICKFMLQKTHQSFKKSVDPGKKSKFNKRRAFNKGVGPGKKSKINKRRAYVYSGL